MAVVDTNFQNFGDGEQFSPMPDDYDQPMDEAELMASQANVLTLEENRPLSSEGQENEDDRSYPQYEDQGTVSDDGQEVKHDQWSITVQLVIVLCLDFLVEILEPISLRDYNVVLDKPPLEHIPERVMFQYM